MVNKFRANYWMKINNINKTMMRTKKIKTHKI